MGLKECIRLPAFNELTPQNKSVFRKSECWVESRNPQHLIKANTMVYTVHKISSKLFPSVLTQSVHIYIYIYICVYMKRYELIQYNEHCDESLVSMREGIS
jgi:hypothetical protein